MARRGRRTIIALAVLLVAALVAIRAVRRHPTDVARGAPATGSPRQDSIPAASADDTLGFPYLPDPARTPGAILAVTAADICVPGYAKKVRNVPAAVKRQVYRSYGIARHRPGDYEVDHLISLELGGSNSVRNLWPESYRTSPWNARVKDRLENELHRRVCAGSMPLDEAQRLIAGNWVAAYRRYVEPEPRAVR